MSKYIVEIEEKPLCVFDKDTQTYFPRLWRVKGFNSLVFDEEGLSRLEELNSDYINEHFGEMQDEAYKRGINDGSLDVKQRVEGAYQSGLNDAWEAARKIILNCEDGGVSGVVLREEFGTRNTYTVIKENTASEAIEKLKAYEEKQKADDKIEVGDELTAYSGLKCIATVADYENDIFYVMFSDGSSGKRDVKTLKKTGRHFDIASILEAMREVTT